MNASLTSLRHLLRLLDDPSPEVQRAIREEMARMAPRLPEVLAELPEPLPATDRRLLQRLMAEERRIWWREAWPRWRERRRVPSAAEEAFDLVSRFMDATLPDDGLAHRLQDLAELARHRGADQDPMDLARFLFQDLRLAGETSDHSNPRTASMAAVIEEKCGLPVVLTWIYVLVARRLGLEVRPLPVNRHYLALAEAPQGGFLVDCSHRAASYRMSDVPDDTRLKLQASLASSETATDGVMARLLGHLADCYRRLGLSGQAAFIEPFRQEIAGLSQDSAV